MYRVYFLVLLWVTNFGLESLSQDTCKLDLIIIPEHGQYGYNIKVFDDSSTVSKKILTIDTNALIILGKEIDVYREINSTNRNAIVKELVNILKNVSGKSRLYFVRREYRIKTIEGTYVMTPDVPENTMSEFEKKLEKLILKFTSSFSAKISYERL